MFEFNFLAEDENGENELKDTYKIIIADDDIEVHSITKMALEGFLFNDKQLEIIDTYSGAETKKVIEENPDTAIILLDVVMEEVNSGLDVVDYMRYELGNELTRVILRTGQPGDSPKESVIRKYEINDYLLKTELTVQKLYVAMLTGLRNYRDLQKIDKHKKGLEKIIEASSNLFNHSSFDDFLGSILNEMSHFYKDEPSMLYLAESKDEKNGFVSIEKYNKARIVAATGKYGKYIGKDISEITELDFICNCMKGLNVKADDNINFVENGFLIKSAGNNQLSNYIFIEGNNDEYDFKLINLFLKNYSMALDNFILNSTINATQEEIIFALGDCIENQIDFNSDHVRRISDMMYRFSMINGFSDAESEILRVASTMHDIGKIRIPNEILNKKGSLTDAEFEIIKTHTTIGFDILSKSKLDVLQIAANIALNHQEKYDGSGYPIGLKGNLIPKSSRMLAIIDVYDTITHKRIYKDAASKEEAIKYLIDNKNKHFDPRLVELFMNNYNNIVID